MKGIIIGGHFFLLTIIVCYCLCITVIDCDEKSLHYKRSFAGSNIERSENKNDKLLSSSTGDEDSVKPETLIKDSERPSEERKILPALETISQNDPSVKKTDDKSLTSNNSEPKVIKPVESNASPSSSPSTTNTTKAPGLPPNNEVVNTGAMLRGASVFLGLSIVVMAYIIFRCSRLNKRGTQMVRKYGILAHRQDVEMRPLPLNDEDEDDTTVFDASEVAAIHDKQRRIT